jgi:hypothetical protein
MKAISSGVNIEKKVSAMASLSGGGSCQRDPCEPAGGYQAERRTPAEGTVEGVAPFAMGEFHRLADKPLAWTMNLYRSTESFIG